MPSVEIRLDQEPKLYDFFLICPTTLSILLESIPEREKVGTISIKYPDIVDAEEEDDYNEEEQLYSAMNKKTLQEVYPNEDIPLYAFDNSLCTLVPPFRNVITNNVVATELVNTFSKKVAKTWITTSPFPINSKQTINILQEGELDQELEICMDLPLLNPPNYITGISGSIASRVSQLSTPKLASLVLNGEGPFGFEKVDTEALNDAGVVLTNIIAPTKRNMYSKTLSTIIRKSYANSRIYI